MSEEQYFENSLVNKMQQNIFVNLYLYFANWLSTVRKKTLSTR